MKLSDVREINERIHTMERRLKVSREAAENLTRPLDGLPRAKGFGSKTEKIAASIVDIERELAELRAERTAAKIELVAEIFKRVRHADAFTVLEMRYVRCHSFKEISERLHFSAARIYELHRRGRRDFDAAVKS